MVVPLTATTLATGARPVTADVAELSTAVPLSGSPVAETGVTSNLINLP